MWQTSKNTFFVVVFFECDFGLGTAVCSGCNMVWSYTGFFGILVLVNRLTHLGWRGQKEDMEWFWVHNCLLTGWEQLSSEACGTQIWAASSLVSLEGVEDKSFVSTFTTCSLRVKPPAYMICVRCSGINQTPEYETSLINVPIHSHIPCNALWNLNKQGSVPVSPLTAIQASSLVERGAEGHRLVKQPFDRPGLLSIEMLAEYEFQPWTLTALSTEVLFGRTAQSDSRPAPDPSLLEQLSFRFQPCSFTAFHYTECPRLTTTKILACYATTVCVTLVTKTLLFSPGFMHINQKPWIPRLPRH